MSPKKRKITFTLKYSQVQGNTEDEKLADGSDQSDVEVSDADSEEGGVELGEDFDMRSIKSAESDAGDATTHTDDLGQSVNEAVANTAALSLSTPGFDRTGGMLDFEEKKDLSASDSDAENLKKRRRSKKATIKEDRTGDLDAYGPQSVADYERILLGQPNSAEMWVRYIVFQRELNEIDNARQIARRALATINPREEQERLDVWTALLHLENDFASSDELEDIFKEACQHNDSRETHERMIKIYITSRKLDVSRIALHCLLRRANGTIESR